MREEERMSERNIEKERKRGREIGEKENVVEVMMV